MPRGLLPAAGPPDLELVAAACQRAPMALQMLGDRWALLILRDAFMGARRFSEFQQLSGAPSGTLTARLRTLVDQGVFYRNPLGTNSGSFEYRLTDRGLDLTDFALCIWAWEHKWGGDSGLPPALLHRGCGALARPSVICRGCGKPVHPQDIAYEPGPGYASRLPNRAVSRRRESRRLRMAPHVDRTFHRVIDVFGDRWSSRLLAALFMGVSRYDELGKSLGISTNILSERLRRLVGYGIVARREGIDQGYALTSAGRDLFPAVIAIHRWSNRWAAGQAGAALLIRHVPCGAPLDPVTVCHRCDQPLLLHDLSLRATAGTRRIR